MSDTENPPEEEEKEPPRPDQEGQGFSLMNTAAGALKGVISYVSGSKGEDPEQQDGDEAEKVRTSSTSEPGWVNIDVSDGKNCLSEPEPVIE